MIPRISIHIHYEDDDGLKLDTRLTTNPESDRANSHVCTLEKMTSMLEKIQIASDEHLVAPEVKPAPKPSGYNRNGTPTETPVVLMDWRVRLRKIQGLIKLERTKSNDIGT